MTYCNKCGKQLADGAAFCSACGAPTAQNWQKEECNSDSRENVWEGSTHRCPECGQPIPSFRDRCPFCGHEFRGVHAVVSARELSDRLDAIEASRPTETKKKKGTNGRQEIGPTDERKIALIRSYPIPNAREDLIEFLVLALSNCDHRFDEFGDEQGTEAEKAIANAWETKLDQAFSKAEILFGDEPEFASLKGMRDKKKGEIEQEKARGRRYFAKFMLAMLGVFIFLMIMNIFIIKFTQ